MQLCGRPWDSVFISLSIDFLMFKGRVWTVISNHLETPIISDSDLISDNYHLLNRLPLLSLPAALVIRTPWAQPSHTQPHKLTNAAMVKMCCPAVRAQGGLSSPHHLSVSWSSSAMSLSGRVMSILYHSEDSKLCYMKPQESPSNLPSPSQG